MDRVVETLQLALVSPVKHLVEPLRCRTRLGEPDALFASGLIMAIILRADLHRYACHRIITGDAGAKSGG